MNRLDTTARRPLLPVATGLLFFAVLAIACAEPAAEGPGAQEKANIEVVNGFMAAWSDPDQAVTFLAPDAAVRMIEDQPAVVGRAAIAAAFKGFLTPDVTLKIETLDTKAHGPVVLNKRIDTLETTGEPDQVFPVVGVFVVKNGKITEWTDYLDK
jgi:limonene-1,2-epoxide hydrolase